MKKCGILHRRVFLTLSVLAFSSHAALSGTPVESQSRQGKRSWSENMLLASTFFGGSGDEGWQYSGAIDIAVDGDNNLYVVGMTVSADLPTTDGALQENIASSQSDVFIAEFDSRLTHLIACTYLGGTYAEEEPKIAVDRDGNIVVIGCTNSPDFPTLADSYDRIRNGPWDVFIVKLDPALTTLLGSTLLGGDGEERMVSLALDEEDNIFAAGYTTYQNFPTTANAYDRTYNGGNTDFFISKFVSDLTTLSASTFLGGRYHEQWPSIELDATGGVYIGGSTGSYDYPTTPNAYAIEFSGPHQYDHLNVDVCLSHFDNDLRVLLNSTLIGTDGFDGGMLMGKDNSGHIFIGGHTESTDFPFTAGVYDEDHNGENEYFICKFDSTLSQLVASTFLTADDESFSFCVDITCDDEGNVYLVGASFDQDFSTTRDPYDETFNGGWSDVFLRKFDPDLTTLVFSTFLGGDGDEGDIGIALNGSGNVCLAGYTSSAYFPVGPGCYDETPNGGTDCFVTAMNVRAGQFTRRDEGIEVNDDGFSHGICWIDYDNDHWLDLFVTNWDYNMVEGDINFLYHNNGDGTFDKVTSGPLISDDNSLAASWGDYDNDGDLDAYVVNAGENNYFYINAGDGNFTKVTDSPVMEESEFFMGAMWIDYDNDGWLDLFVVNHRPPGEPPDVENDLYHNENGLFARQDNEDIGLIKDEGNSAAWGDYDGDGDLDLFLTRNDNLSLLFQNDGDGTFKQITTGVIVSEVTSGGSWVDYDNDGDLDLSAMRGYPGTLRLYENLGDGSFSRVTGQDIVNDRGFWVSGYWGDYDNDGDLDLFMTGMYFYGPNVNRLYENNGETGFTTVTTGQIATDVEPSIAAAWGDLDRDGDLDLFVTNTGGEDNTLYVNNGNSNSWISITCIGTVSNRSAIGAKVRARATIAQVPIWQLREITSQSGYVSQNSLDAHFGLGDASLVDSIRVEWPSGIISVLTDVETNQFLTIVEPEYSDTDDDGIADDDDNCPHASNPEQDDADGDGVGDVCDNCPEMANPDQADADADDAGDLCDSCTDSDGDDYGDPGFPANTCPEDNCPDTFNPDQAPVERGDINCEGGINVLDVLVVVNHILGVGPLSGGPLERADCNDDGNVNVLDALGIVNVILGIGQCGS